MTVYLLHLESPMSQGPDPRTGHERAAQHYVGYADNLDGRLAHHRNGTGARMLQVAQERGITFKLARVWDGASRTFERKLKNTHKVKAYCPFCAGSRARKYAPKDQPAGQPAPVPAEETDLPF